MKRDNLEKLKDIYKVWLEKCDSWSRHVKFIDTPLGKAEEQEAVAVLPNNTAAYIGEVLRQVIESEEEVK